MNCTKIYVQFQTFIVLIVCINSVHNEKYYLLGNNAVWSVES
jgi:hypothetical protein